VNDRTATRASTVSSRHAWCCQHADPPVVTVVWTTKGEKGTRIVFARLGGWWTLVHARATVPGGDAPGNRGWEAVAVTRGVVNVVWLDHRELTAPDSPEKSMAAMHHQYSGAKLDGVATAKSKLYLAAIDGSAAPQAITGGVCYCCKTALAARADGAVFAAWRHVYPGNIRDIAFTSSRDGGRTFTPAGSRERGQVGARRMSRRWAGDGDRRAKWDSHRVADAGDRVGRPDHRALLRLVRRRTDVHDTRADSDRRDAASSADRKRGGRLAGARVGRARRGMRRAAFARDGERDRAPHIRTDHRQRR
jgi:hypothetical protein